jgi:RHS repeat-associated protein
LRTTPGAARASTTPTTSSGGWSRPTGGSSAEGAITLSNFNHEWTLGQTGNWNRSKLDLNGDADWTDTDELDENNPLASGGGEHFNKANELAARDTDNNGSDNYTLAYDEVGNMTDDGKEYEYVYDAFGRLRKIKNTSNQALVSEYWYNGLGHRITWHADTTRSGGGAPDGSVNTDDPKVHLIYNERWQCVATYRQANGSEIDTYPKEQWVYHAAGLAGWGSSSYIDAVILRDDHEDDWTEAADSTLERRVYYCQNWRADVVALLAENGRVLERAWYEPYGTPHGMSAADFSGTSDDTNDHYLVPDGDADADDSFVYLDLFGVSAALSDMTGSSDPGDGEYGRPNGTVDSDDYFYFLDQYSVAASLGRNVLSAGHDGATASHGAGNLRNRRGLAGYEWDPHVRRYHVRHRVLYPEIGRWTRRDPLGYVDGMGLHGYVRSMALLAVDSIGLASTSSVGMVWRPRRSRVSACVVPIRHWPSVAGE